MPLEARPLFRPDVVRSRMRNYTPPLRVSNGRERLKRWADLLSTDRGEHLKEQELLPDFLSDVFYDVLGYTGPADNKQYTLSREKHVEADGEFADAVLGYFGAPKGDRFVAAVEGKGPRDPLDRPWAGRRMSAVDQGYRYAINLPAEWVVVTNMRETRLYYKGANQRTYEQFETSRLAEDEDAHFRFAYLLDAENVVPKTGQCHLKDLLAESEKADLDLTRDYYDKYAEIRQASFAALRKGNPKVPPECLLAMAQKLLDRILFCAFCEDRDLLPEETLRKAFEYKDPYAPRPVWENFKSLFKAVNAGNKALKIPAYNGGLFADDPELDGLAVTDKVCEFFRDLGTYNYRAPSGQAQDGEAERLVDVDILGHIFEKSITDLEQLRERIDAGEDIAPPKGKKKLMNRRKREGAFYTPPFVTRYIVEQALSPVLFDRYERLRQEHYAKAENTAKKALENPRAYDYATIKKPQREALIKFWEAWHDELATVRLLDPACGSGAFLIEAFDQFYTKYQRTNDRLNELRGHRTLFDPDKTILQENLFGVDLNSEAVEICRLSLWIKTAQRGKVLADLNHNVLVGNSIVADGSLDPKAVDWKKSFPDVFMAGGFDVVVGNPPYVRQELLSSIKPYLEKEYAAYHGMADLYVYFYERGLKALRPGGRLSFIVTNKWMKAGYGEPLRKFFGERAWMESVVDFGHAKQIFEDADVFPCIVVVRKPTTEPEPKAARVCAIPREQLCIDDLSEQIRTEGFEVPRETLGAEAWQLEPPGLANLFEKMRKAGKPLSEYAGAEPLVGIKTGFNQGFLIDDETKMALVKAHSKAQDVLLPYIRGQDVKRWKPEWAKLWIILMKSSQNFKWPWAGCKPKEAEVLFQKAYPSIYGHMKPLEARLKKRTDQGENWWELRSCAYYEKLSKEKIIWQDLSFHSRFCLDSMLVIPEMTCFSLPSDDPWLLAVLNAPLMWSYLWRATIHGKDEVLRLKTVYMNEIPIADPGGSTKKTASAKVRDLISLTGQQVEARDTLLSWFRVEYDIEKPSRTLQEPQDLDVSAFVAEVRKVRGKKAGKLTVAALKALQDEHARTVEPMRERAAKALALEREISDLVNGAYGLTPDEVRLMWQTAPPRMPIGNERA